MSYKPRARLLAPFLDVTRPSGTPRVSRPRPRLPEDWTDPSPHPTWEEELAEAEEE